MSANAAFVTDFHLLTLHNVYYALRQLHCRKKHNESKQVHRGKGCEPFPWDARCLLAQRSSSHLWDVRSVARGMYRRQFAWSAALHENRGFSLVDVAAFLSASSVQMGAPAPFSSRACMRALCARLVIYAILQATF